VNSVRAVTPLRHHAAIQHPSRGVRIRARSIRAYSNRLPSHATRNSMVRAPACSAPPCASLLLGSQLTTPSLAMSQGPQHRGAVWDGNRTCGGQPNNSDGGGGHVRAVHGCWKAELLCRSSRRRGVDVGMWQIGEARPWRLRIYQHTLQGEYRSVHRQCTVHLATCSHASRVAAGWNDAGGASARLTCFMLQVEALVDRASIVQAALGDNHSVFLDTNGHLWSCGENREVRAPRMACCKQGASHSTQTDDGCTGPPQGQCGLGSGGDAGPAKQGRELQQQMSLLAFHEHFRMLQSQPLGVRPCRDTPVPCATPLPGPASTLPLLTSTARWRACHGNSAAPPACLGCHAPA
jgi:hypothetical protein